MTHTFLVPELNLQVPYLGKLQEIFWTSIGRETECHVERQATLMIVLKARVPSIFVSRSEFVIRRPMQHP